jgi:hypothetical protein
LRRIATDTGVASGQSKVFGFFLNRASSSSYASPAAYFSRHKS